MDPDPHPSPSVPSSPVSSPSSPSARAGPDDDPGLPPPPAASAAPGDGPVPAWVAELRGRLGLDGRAVAWVVVAVVALAVGAWLLRPAGAAVEEALPMAASTSEPTSAGGEGATAPVGSSSTTGPEPTELVVHAAGAVVAPGVYALPPTARVDDLVRAAGGLAPDADGARINLAAPLADGARVYVPRVGEEAPPAVVGPDGGGAPAGGAGVDGGVAGGSSGGATGAGPIDLNTATEAELDELPGVGPAIAAAIVAFREQNGGFTSVDDLLDVRGIGEAKLADIRPLVVV